MEIGPFAFLRKLVEGQFSTSIQVPTVD